MQKEIGEEKKEQGIGYLEYYEEAGISKKDTRN